MKAKKTRGKFSPKKNSPDEQIEEALKGAASEIKKATKDVVDFGVGGVKIDENGVASIGPVKASELMERGVQQRELTPREIQQRDRDCKVEYSTVVPSGMHKALDESRRASWIPPSEVEKMPQWKPVMQPAVDQVISESVKEVAAWMDTVIREEKDKLVDKLVPRVMKLLPAEKKDKGLVAERIRGTLYELQREQGVSNKHLIGRVISK